MTTQIHTQTIAGRTLPIFAYDATGPERAVVTNAVDELTSQCAARFGLDVHARKVGPTPMNKQKLRRLWGVMTMRDAKNYGYHVPPDLGGGSHHPAGPGASWVGNASGGVSKAKELVIYGNRPALGGAVPTVSPGRHNAKAIPPGGCLGQANRTLGAQHFDPNNFTNMITAGTWKRTMNDARVQKVFGKWTACMTKKGYHYQTPGDANSDQRWGDLEHGSPSHAEVSTAVSDMKCKQSTNLIGLTFSVESANEKAAIAKKLPQLKEHRREWEKIVRKAAHTLGVAPRSEHRC